MKLDAKNLIKITNSIDPIGDVFIGKEKVYRAIHPDKKEFISELFLSGLMDELIEKNYFVKCKISNYELENYSLVIEVEKIEKWNYVHEWSFGMLKLAANTVLEINQIANKYGYEMFDCNSSNMVYVGSEPVYIDLGCFLKIGDIKVWKGYDIFYKSFFIPLKLSSIGFEEISKGLKLRKEYFSRREFMYLTNPLISNKLIDIYIYIINNLRKIELASKKEIREKINNYFLLLLIHIYSSLLKIKIGTPIKAKKLIRKLNRYKKKSLWGDYHDNVKPESSPRFNKVLELINSLEDVESVIELASNQGKLSTYLLNNSKIKNIICTDYDLNAVDIMFEENRGNHNFTPLIINFMMPENADLTFQKRLKSDVSISLAITHHLILTQGYDINCIFQTIKSVTNKYVFIEFMPKGLFNGDVNKTPKIPNYYNLDWFKSNFSNYFKIVYDEELAYNRHLFVGKII